jgi:hypothetical protein
LKKKKKRSPRNRRTPLPSPHNEHPLPCISHVLLLLLLFA